MNYQEKVDSLTDRLILLEDVMRTTSQDNRELKRQYDVALHQRAVLIKERNR